MKTEGRNDILWNGNVDLHLEHEECLPEIGSSHITSLLTNIDNANEKNIENSETVPHDVGLITLDSNKEKPVVQNDNDTQNLNTVMIFEGIACSSKEECINEKSKMKPKSSEENYEDMLYFVCNLCPFLCTKATKITEHLETLHKTNSISKPLTLKCPACTNTFFHKISLRSHLVHDHQVGNTDLKKILQAVIYYAKKNNNNNNNPDNKKSNAVQKAGTTASHFKNEVQLNSTEQSFNLESFGTNDNSETTTSENIITPVIVNVSTVEESVQTNLHILTPKSQTANNKDILSPNSVVNTSPQPSDRIVLSNMIKLQATPSKCLEQTAFHKCEVSTCKVRLRDATKMFYHVRCHTGNSFKCLECDQIFSYWRPLTGHLWRIHKIDMELYACDKCDYKTFSLGKLNNIHKLIHSEVKPFICEVCSKGFKNTKQLRNHKIKHKEFGNKTVQLCVECNKMFSDKRQLRIHMDSVHKKLKPFLCNFCDYKGASKSSLRMHIRQHTGEKPFSCSFCSYTTADHNSLRRHKLRHTGQKPYKCSYCDYACIQSSTFKIHLNTKHHGLEKNLMFACPNCQFRTVNKDMYLSHMSTVHKTSVREVFEKQWQRCNSV